MNLFRAIVKKKGEKECKYWPDADNFSLEEDYSYNRNNKDTRQVKKIIFEYFEFIEYEWNEFQRRSNEN